MLPDPPWINGPHWDAVDEDEGDDTDWDLLNDEERDREADEPGA